MATGAKALTGVDDHSRFCVVALPDARGSRPSGCARGWRWRCGPTGCPAQILTDNGKVFTGRFNQPPVEVLFDRVCRENGIEHLLTQPTVARPRPGRSSGSTGRCAPSSAPTGSSRTWPLRRPSSTSGSTTTTPADPTRPSDMATPADRFHAADPGDGDPAADARPTTAPSRGRPR